MPKPHTDPLPETAVNPEPHLEKRTRRRFSADDKLRILAEADQCAHGELGALLRREKLYSSQLHQWRRDLAEGGVECLSRSTPGPKARLTADQRELDRLRKENARLSRRLEIANGCLELQKKALAMLDHASSGNTP